MDTTAQISAASPQDITRRRRAALRIAVGVAGAFTVFELLGFALAFFPAAIAAQLFAVLAEPPTLKQGIVLPILIAAFSAAALFISALLAHRPLPFMLMLGLLFFAGFYLDAKGKTLPASLLLIVTAVIPVAAAHSQQLASTLADALLLSSIAAILVVWAAFALFPPLTSARQPAPLPRLERAPHRVALVNMLILAPAVWQLLTTNETLAFVIVMVVIAVVRQAERSSAPRIAMALFLANLIGGMAAVVAFGMITLQPHPLMLFLVLLFFGLMFGDGIAAGGPTGPIYGMALQTFVIVLGLGISPLPSDAPDAFVARLGNVFLATLYAVGAMALVLGISRARNAETTPATGAKTTAVHGGAA